MYGLKYILRFKSLSDIPYTVEISQAGYSGGITELTGGMPPFTATTKSSDNLYDPLRLSGGTLKIIGSDYLQALFTTGGQTNKVNLKRGQDIIWTGYITPEVYSQDYSDILFEFDIECVSAISSLEYIKFDKQKDIITIFDLIQASIELSKGDYRGVYMPIVYGTKTRNILRDFTVSSGNFVDEDGIPMTYKEILEEICRFLGWTLTESEGYLYFIDVDYIKKGLGDYFFYNPNFIESVITLSTGKQNVQGVGFMGTGANLDIIPGFNKINVVCSDYEVGDDVIYPNLDNSLLEMKSMESKADKSEQYTKKYYTSSDVWSLYLYKRQGNSFINYYTDIFPHKLAGAILCSRTNYDDNNKPNKLEWEDVIQIKLFDQSDTSLLLDKEGTSDTLYPVIKTVKPSPIIPFEEDINIAIDFKIQFSDSDDGFVPKEKRNKQDQLQYESWYEDKDTDWYVPVKLRIGEYYYNGQSWVKDSSRYFKIYTDIKKKQQHFTFDFLNCKNTNDFTLGVPDLNGLIINQGFAKVGDLEFTIFCPRSTYKRDYNHRYVFMKDISIDLQRKNNKKGSQKKDTLYTNEINEEFIADADDVELKLTSKNSAELSYSKIIHNGTVLDKVYNNITNSEIKPEELIIQRYVNQYMKPKIKTTQPLKLGLIPFQIAIDKWQPNKDFIVTGQDIDYSNNQSVTTLIEIR